MKTYTCQYCDTEHTDRANVKWLDLSATGLNIRIIICNTCVTKHNLGDTNGNV